MKTSFAWNSIIYAYSELDNTRGKEAGGKNSSLGEMFQKLKSEGIRVPDGFATSADAYWKFIDQLSMAVGTIGAAFYPKDVIVRMSDFKSNEYADLIGGQQFEPDEENPMVGFRGASRYYHENYKDGFELECKAMISMAIEKARKKKEIVYR